MSYTITEQNGIVTFDSSGPGHAWRFKGNVVVLGRLTVPDPAYGPLPTASNGAAASSATASVTFSGNDTVGRITVGQSDNAVAGAQAILVFGTAHASAPFITIVPANAATATLSAWVSASMTSFTISTALPAAASGTLSWGYHVFA